MRKALFSAVFVSIVLSFSAVASAQTALPSGIVSVYGVSSSADNAIDKSYYIQLYTSSALKDTLIVQFQFKDSSGAWKNLGPVKTIGTLSSASATVKTSKRMSFSPTGLGMRNGISYSFRALVYEGGKVVKTYDGSSFTFKAASSSTTSSAGSKDAAPTITVSRAQNPAAGEKFKVVATASDDVALKKVDIYLDGSLVQGCSTTTKFFLCDWIGGGWAAGTSHSYYAVATDKSDQKTTSETMTVVVGKANAGNIAYSVGHPEGDFCSDCVGSGKGYNSDTQRCESGSALRSSESRATAAAKNWFFYKRNYNVVDAGKRDPSVRTALSCENIGLAIATKSTKLVTGQEPLPDTRSCADHSYCNTCAGFAQSQCGWDTSDKTCKRGGLTGSDDGKANVSAGNWIFFSTIAGRGSTPGKSCEDVRPQDYQGIPVKAQPSTTESTKVLADTQPSSTAKADVPAPSEVVTKDVAGNIIYVKNQEVEVTVTRGTAPASEPNLLPSASALESANRTNLKCLAQTTCGTCTPSLADSCGWDLNASLCKKGRAIGSDDGTTNLTMGNWVYYTREKNRGSAAGQSCEGAGLLSSESQSASPSALSTSAAPTSVTPTETVTRDAAGNVISVESGEVKATVTRAKSKEEVCASYSACGQCTPSVAEACGWDTGEGKCKAGTSSGSDDGRSSVSAGTWVWWTLKERKGASAGLACDEIGVQPTALAQNADARLEAVCNEKKSCLRCTPSATDNCGWDRSIGLCKHGAATGSDDGKASVSANNWVWYTGTSSKGTNAGLSCDDI